MGPLLGAAFVIGVLTALTPCVLPVLPVILAVGPTGDRRRPIAIAAGLVLSFTLFTLFWTVILDALPIPPDLLRNLAIAIIAVTAVSLIVPAVGALAGRALAPLARISPRTDGSGLILGMALGLVFTPCAGLLMGSVASAAATQDYSLRLLLVVLAYGLGVGVALLAIMLAARRGLAMAPVRRAAPRIQQALGVLVLGAVVVMVLGLDARLAARVPAVLEGPLAIQESSPVARELDRLAGAGGIGVAAAGAPGAGAVAEAGGDDPGALGRLAETLPDYGVPPELTGIQAWINSEATTLAELRGKVVVVDFWTYSCVNCIRTLPHLREWHDTYGDDLVVIGVHTPEFAFEAEPGNVARAVRDLDVPWPVALDSEYSTWSAWGNRYWPAKYILGRDGHVRYAHFGEGAYAESERVIRSLLAEGAPPDALPTPGTADVDDAPFHRPQTPEIYLGHLRAQHFVGPVRRDERFRYTLPADPGPDRVGLGGEWTVRGERALAGAGARLRLHFRGGGVHLVLGPDAEGGGDVEVRLDGGPLRTIRVRAHRLYTVARLDDDAAHRLDITFTPGVAGYAFTFGGLS